MEKAAVVVKDDGKNRHGLPRGYHYVPLDIELIGVLEEKLAGRRLRYPLPNIFHDVRILDYHPAVLYEACKADEEAGYIYFFSLRKFLGAKRTRPVRATKDGNWTASGHGKLVTRDGLTVGYKHTMVFYEKQKTKKSDGLTVWAMHEFTRINGPNKQVADLALYRLYNKKKKNEAGLHLRNLSDDGSPKKKRKKQNKKSEAGQQARTLSSGLPKSEELPSQSPMVGGTSMPSTSQAQAQASVGQPHDCYHQYAFAAAPLMAAPSENYWPQQQAPATPVCPQQQAINDFDLADWDNTLPSLPPLLSPSTVSGTAAIGHNLPQAINDFDLADWDNTLLSLPPLLSPSTVSGTAAIGHNLPTSQQQDAEYPGPAVSNEQPLTMLPPSPLTVPGTAVEGGYPDDEFKVCSEMEQEPTVLGPAAVGHNLLTSQQQDAEYAVSDEKRLKMLPPPPEPAPATDAEGGYLDDELKAFCEMQQLEQPAASPCCWLSMLDDDDDLPRLMDEENYKCTLDELLGPMHDEDLMSIEEADPDDQV